MQNFHIITAKYLPVSEHRPARIRIYSARFDQSVIVSFHEYETAGEWLRKNGFEIVGTGYSKNEVVLVSTTFKPLKPSK